MSACTLIETSVVCMSCLIGNSLTIVNGKRWKQMRKLLTPAFHADILKPYIKLFQESTSTLLVRYTIKAKPSYGTSKQNLSKYQDVLSSVITSFILIT